MITGIGLRYIIIFLMGTFAFSLVNVLICRIPAHMPIGNECGACPKSKHIVNRKEKRSARYPLIVALGGSLAVLSVYWFGKSGDFGLKGILQALLVFTLLGILTVISFIDIDTLVIPNGLVAAVMLCSIAAVPLFPHIGIGVRIIGAFAVSLPMALLAIFTAGAFGGGDIKLMAAAGLLLGWRCVWIAFLTAVLTGGIYSAYLLLSKNEDRKGRFAFGPFLCAGIAVAVFAGEGIIQWYGG